MVLAQADRDDSIRKLMEKLADIYEFLGKEEQKKRLHHMDSTDIFFGNLVKQIVECANFIGHYAETKNFCE